jgi:hypothetical protein
VLEIKAEAHCAASTSALVGTGVNKRERRRIQRLERRCDWLEGRIAIRESRGEEVRYDVAELSALRWAIERLKTSPEALWDLNRQLKEKIERQRLAIRKLIAYQHRIALTDNELDAVVDAASLGEAEDTAT